MLTRVDKLFATRAPKRFLFQEIKKFLPENSAAFVRIQHAYNGARKACVNRMRDDGTKAIGHGRAVCLIGVTVLGIKDPARIIAMLKHDVVEDIPGWTHELVEEVDGQDVAYYIKWLSKPPKRLFQTKEARDDAYARSFLSAPKKVVECKLCDVLHNLRTLFACDEAKQRRIVAVARNIYLPLARKHKILAEEMETAILRVEAGWAGNSLNVPTQRVSQLAVAKRSA